VSGAPAPAAVISPAAAALAPYAGLTLKAGARGPAVVALQKALHLPADGVFGPTTAAAVKAFNDAWRLPAEAVVRPATWVALGAPATPDGKAADAARRWVPASGV
jgi:peptidoglycan hydrolase-like protein with peptidoglycan-binding domain